MSALGLSTTRGRRSLLQRIAEAFPPPAQWPAFVACLLLLAILALMARDMPATGLYLINALGAAADAVFRTIQGVMA